MMEIDLKKWSERQQVLAIILTAGLVIFLLWFFLLLPQNRKRELLEKEIESGRAQLEQGNYLLDENALTRLREAERAYNSSLSSEWMATVQRITSFTNMQEFTSLKMGHIDFKVALFEVRYRLQKNAESLKISLPKDLGMDETVTSEEDSRKLMIQLRTVETLVNLALDLNLDAVKCIEPFPVLFRETESGKEAYLEEYPVHVELAGSMDDLYSLFRGINKTGQVFVLKHLKIAAPSPGKPDVLSINCVLSAMVFTKKPTDLAAKPRKPLTSAPVGH
ncbi:MAG: hypothetical protein C0404_13960 [Verrucomicrobia bacterium]|nr:hypothetical protein [Verrucomicrobiota bacterium]